MGEFVARLATSRLDGLYLLSRLQDARALEGACAWRATFTTASCSRRPAQRCTCWQRVGCSSDPAAGKQRLDEVQQQLEHGELEMQAFIRDLRPARRPATSGALSSRERVQNHAGLIERQWNIGSL